MQAHRPYWLAKAIEMCTHATISHILNSAMFLHFANQNVSAQALYAIYIFPWMGLFNKLFNATRNVTDLQI